MSQLGEFLKAKQPLFDQALAQLEDQTGQAGVDAKLTADIATKAADRIKQLGLPPDCSGPDLYQALVSRVKQDDDRLAKAIGGTDPASLPEMLPLIAKAVQKVDIPRSGFFLKESKAQDMMRQMPPPQTLSRLGYSDVETMLKTEDIHELYLALRFAEDSDWLNRFNETYQELTADDFTNREIRLIQYDAAKWGDIAEHFIAKKIHNIANSKEIGAIGMMPMTAKTMRGITLKALPLIFHYYNELRLYSAFFKLMGPKRNFGEIVATTLIADPSPVKVTQGQFIHWRVLQRYFGKLKDESHPEAFEPHVHPEDLHWRRAEEVLYDLDPELEFWQDMDYVAVQKGAETVTFNFMDISFGYSNQVAYGDRYLYHFQESLWNQVFASYLGQKTLEDQILTQLDNDLIAPERLTLPRGN